MSDQPPNDLVDLIRNRRSLRAYKTDPVPPDILERCLQAARWAASCSNGQPWRFMIGDNQRSPQVRQALYDILAGGNQIWCERAPVLMLACAQPKFEDSGKPNPWYKHDLGQSLANFAIQATAEELNVHMMAGFDRDAAAELLERDDVEPWTMVAVGYPDKPEVLPNDTLKDRELADRSRKPLADLILNPLHDG